MKPPDTSGVSRRQLLGVAGLTGVAAVAVGAGAGVALARPASASDSHPFREEHQPGVVTEMQNHLHFAAFDLMTRDREEVAAMLRRWTTAAELLMAGHSLDTTSVAYDAPPADSGDAEGLSASHLTITIGFGPGLFRALRMQDQRPAALVDLPHYPADNLDPAGSGGDLCIQACADDPQVAVHAVRNLARLAFGVAAVRWSQLGFGRSSATTADQSTPRNLFGFKDGTANVRADDTATLTDHVWVSSSDDPAWMRGGTYLVARRILMRMEVWDRTSLREQEATFGRTRTAGAPLSGGDEAATPDFAMTAADGQPIIPMDSHMRLAHPDQNAGARMLRRGYNYTDGSDGLGRLDAGLFFLAFQRDPRTAFMPVQAALARTDRLNEYIQHTGSAVFAIPPGVPGGADWIGGTLLV